MQVLDVNPEPPPYTLSFYLALGPQPHTTQPLLGRVHPGEENNYVATPIPPGWFTWELWARASGSYQCRLLLFGNYNPPRLRDRTNEGTF